MQLDDARIDTLGIIGGGYAARQLVRATLALGRRVVAFDPSAHPAPADAVRAAEVLADACDVVTVANENVALPLLEVVARRTTLRPQLDALATAQDRVREREWLERAGFNVLPWRAAHTRDTLLAAVRALGGPCWVKPQLRRRADVRPVLVVTADDAERAWAAMRGAPVVAEAAALVDAEITVMAARSAAGAVETYAPASAARLDGRLLWATVPAGLPEPIDTRARNLAGYVARKLDVVGVLAVELFLLTDGRLVVNELVPAPHPTYDATEAAATTSQFEQHVRCALGLAPGAATVLLPAATLVLDDESSAGRGQLERALDVVGVRAHVFPSRAGGSTGYLSAVGISVDDAVTRLLVAEAGRDPQHAGRLARHRERVAREAWPRRGPPAAAVGDEPRAR